MTKRSTIERNARMDKKKCKHCGCLFPPRRRGQMFCSDACRFDYHSAKNAVLRKAAILRGD